MKNILHRKPRSTLKIKSINSGFTLVETVMAGVIVAAVIMAVARLNVSAMVTGRNQSSRDKIESAINDHIQLLQMQDSYLTKEAITDPNGLDTALNTACEAPSAFLKNHLIKTNVAGNVGHPEVAIEWNDANPFLLVITYSFEAPESSIGSEKRITELNPNFSSQCYDLQ